MPQLRKGQIVHYVHGLDDPYPGAVEPAIIVRVSGDESVGYEAAISVFGSHGQLYRDGVLSPGPVSLSTVRPTPPAHERSDH